MSYLSDEQIMILQDSVSLYSIDEIDDILHYSFDSGIEEYNQFLFERALEFHSLHISNTFLLVHNSTNELLGYMTLSADSIKLKDEEKNGTEIQEVTFGSIPAVKVGKLATNKILSNEAKQKGYGSFLLELARAYAVQANENGIACRFITVDADIEYDENTPSFYYKNGFVENLRYKKKNPSHTISMRKDIFDDDN